MASSGYIVELAMQPGGRRRHDLVVVGEADDAIRVLETEFANPDPDVAALAVDFLIAGMRVRVFAIQGGTPRATIDVRPFLRARLIDGRKVELAALSEDSISGVALELDDKRLRTTLPRSAGAGVKPGETLTFQIDGLQARQLDAEVLYFLEHPVKWGYKNIEGQAATPHLRRAFPRKKPATRTNRKR